VPAIKPPVLPRLDDAQAVLPTPRPTPKVEKRPPPKRKVLRKKPIIPDRRNELRANAPRAPEQTQQANPARAPAAEASHAPSVSQASWQGALIAYLNRYKRYPPGATHTGVASVAFTINRSGQVLSACLIRSSGDSALDREAVSMVRRASPVPAPPSGVGGRTINLAVPIRFNREGP
jgi:protein TonB